MLIFIGFPQIYKPLVNNSFISPPCPSWNLFFWLDNSLDRNDFPEHPGPVMHIKDNWIYIKKILITLSSLIDVRKFFPSSVIVMSLSIFINWIASSLKDDIII